MNRPRGWRHAVAVACAALFVGGCTRPGPLADPSTSGTGGKGAIRIAAGAPIELGTLLSTSGDTSEQGVETLGGITLAIDYLDGRLDGKPGALFPGHAVQLVNVDEGCSADGGGAGARLLAADPQLVGVVGTSCSVAAAGEADRILSQRGVVLVSPSNIAPGLTAPGVHQPYYLRVAPNGAMEAAVAADFVSQKLGVRTATAITTDDGSENALASEFIQRFAESGGETSVTPPIQTPTGLRKAVKRMGSHPPGVVFYERSDPGPGCGQLSRTMSADPALAGTSLILAGACTQSASIGVGAPPVVGTYVVGPDPASFEDFYARQVLPAYTREFGAPPATTWPAYGYDAASIVFDALQRSVKVRDDGSLIVDRTALRDALFATSDYLGLTGTITCDDSGDCASDVRMSVFRLPDVPGPGGVPPVQPLFTEGLSPSDLSA